MSSQNDKEKLTPPKNVPIPEVEGSELYKRCKLNDDRFVFLMGAISRLEAQLTLFENNHLSHIAADIDMLMKRIDYIDKKIRA